MFQWLLQILGGLCLGGVCVLMILFFMLRRKIKAYAENMELIEEAEAVEVHLEELELPEWRNPSEVHRLGHELQDAGFTEIGSFLPKELAKSLLINAWIKEDDCLFAIVSDHKMIGVWVDIAAGLEDGPNLTVSSSTRDLPSVLPPNSEIVSGKEASVEELLEMINERLKGKSVREICADDFVTIYEENYREAKLWQLLRLSPGEEEVREMIKKMGKEATQEQIDGVRSIQREQSLDKIYDLCVKAFLDSDQISASRWEEVRDRVVVIHDLFSEEEILAIYHRKHSSDDEVTNKLQKRDEHPDFSAIGFFKELMRQGQGRFDFESLGKVDFPLSAEIFLGPSCEEVDEAEEEDD